MYSSNYRQFESDIKAKFSWKLNIPMASDKTKANTYFKNRMRHVCVSHGDKSSSNSNRKKQQWLWRKATERLWITRDKLIFFKDIGPIFSTFLNLIVKLNPPIFVFGKIVKVKRGILALVITITSWAVYNERYTSKVAWNHQIYATKY